MTEKSNYIQENQDSPRFLIDLGKDEIIEQQDQDSPRALIDLQHPEDDQQIPLRDLIQTEILNESRPPFESFEELDPMTIRPVATIPDYSAPTMCGYPMIVRTATDCHCIEGWALVQTAIESGKTTIRCHITYVQEASENELAIQKAASRIMTRGGRASYLEIVRNIQILFKLLSATTENLIIYSHGGARRGSAFISNREDNIREILAERLGKSVTTINSYLNHGRYLNDEAFAALARAGKKKDFFEDIQVVRRIFEKNLRHDRFTDDVITAQISEKVIRMSQDPNEIMNLRRDLMQSAEADSSNNAQSDAVDSEVSEQPRSFDHWAGNEDPKDVQPLRIEEILMKGMEIVARLTQIFDNANLPLSEIKQAMTGEIQNLIALNLEIQSEEEGEESPSSMEVV